MTTTRISVWVNEVLLAWSEWSREDEPKRRAPEIKMPVKPGFSRPWELSGFT